MTVIEDAEWLIYVFGVVLPYLAREMVRTAMAEPAYGVVLVAFWLTLTCALWSHGTRLEYSLRNSS